MRGNCISKSLRFLQITAEHQDCPAFIVFLTVKTSSQNISIILLKIPLKLHQHRDGYRGGKKLRERLESSQCREIRLQVPIK